jgi:CMP-N,N'-diacetyllegionaminic acid synthase
MTEFNDNIILIPARSGSTRIKDKNLKLLKGNPLIFYAIKSAIKSQCGPVYVSTDSLKYAEIAGTYGAEVPYLRPKYLSSSTTPSIWVIIHFLKWFQSKNGFVPSFITFCPPTNPNLKHNTISSMLEKLREKKEFNSIVTYTKPKTHPFRIIGLDSSGRIINDIVNIKGKTINDYERSQDFPKCYEGSPACRITRTVFFLNLLKKFKSIKKIKYNKTYDYAKCIGYEISEEESIDIDTLDDFVKAENY